MRRRSFILALSLVAAAHCLNAQTPCTPDQSTLCLNGGRFRVAASWRSTTDSGQAHAVGLTGDTGYFWFFSSGNVEAIVKALDGCAFNSRYWVFASGLTNVEVTLTVTDTQSGITRTYVNPVNTAFQPIQDTAAFATCPGTVLTVSQVTGTYATAVRLLDNTCGSVTVTPNPTTVTAGLAAGRFVLTHAGNSYDGTLQDDGHFTTDPKVLTSGGTQFTIRISGQFSGTGFLAQTTIDQSGIAGSCHYTVEWTGTR
ncbi:MAG: hypothetical protein M3167_10355 [Acidobacteriota bacterium]|nr:hypothetical protein [Acidobacteriota bacterium]